MMDWFEIMLMENSVPSQLAPKHFSSDVEVVSVRRVKNSYEYLKKAAQQSVRRTAYAAGGLGLLAGVVIGYILGVR